MMALSFGQVEIGVKKKNIYDQLCSNDSNIKNLADLNDNQQKYFDLVFGTHT